VTEAEARKQLIEAHQALQKTAVDDAAAYRARREAKNKAVRIFVAIVCQEGNHG
jgi:hypothetical protein